MRRFLDLLCGAAIGIGLFGFVECFYGFGFDLQDKLFYMCVILSGIIATMVDIN